MLIHDIPPTAENQPSVFCAPNANLSILPSHRRQEGKSIKSSSGFSGKGFKFDETEHALANERKKLQKHALGLQDSDDEDGPLDVSTDHPPQGGEFECPRSTTRMAGVRWEGPPPGGTDGSAGKVVQSTS